MLRHVDRVATRASLDARKLRDRLRACASFHLVVPMIESWLFADPGGPSRAGVPPAHLPARLRPDSDPEHFATDDDAYTRDDGTLCTAWHGLQPPDREKNRPEWLKPTYARELHPKRYMAWLCRTPTERGCSAYTEPIAAPALRQLAWSEVLRPPDRMQFARALICDIAHGLAHTPPEVALGGVQAPLTSIESSRSDPALRNL